MTVWRLPSVGSDDGTWGDILNQYIKKQHYDDGTDNATDNGGHQKVTIRAGTAAAGTAPLKLTSGTLLTTPEAGAVEYLTNQFYIRGSDGLSVAGNVGIGTSAPGAMLHVYNSAIHYNGTGKPSTALNLGARIDEAGGGSSVDFNLVWQDTGIYKVTGPTTGWLAGRVAGIYDTQVANGGALAFYTNSGVGADGGANSASVTEKVRIGPNGNVGIGQTPTAVLHLKAGTATASTAPIKLTSGTVLTAPEAGTMEFTTDSLYFTTTTGPTRKTIAWTDGTNLSGVVTTKDYTQALMLGGM